MNQLERIAFKVGRDLVFVGIQDVVLVEAENIYCRVVLTTGESLLVSNTMHSIERLLSFSHFFKVHRSYIVNLQCVVRYNRSDGELYLNGRTDAVPVSRAIKPMFEQLILSDRFALVFKDDAH
ncbi:MAG: LytTR family DNA-binding domain-containing protein [Sediminibacterium sp.]|nr:LytTR family DNA-binding domain-containing protein [Sediminibacterium sp.]